MKTKKSIIIVIAIMLVVFLYGCGSSDSAEPKSDSGKEASEEAAEDASEDTNEDAAEDSDEDTTEDSNDSAESAALADFNQVIVDRDNVKFEIKEIDPKDFWGYAVKAYLENNTDKSLMYSIEDASINGLMMDPFWASEVSAGKKSNESISWGSTSLKEGGIEEVTNIEFRLRIHDSEDYAADDIVNDFFTVYPLGEDKASEYVRESSDKDIVLFDNDACSMTVTGADPDGIFGYGVKVYLENKTDKNLMFSVEEASVNGFMADPFWSKSVVAGKKAFSDISWTSNSFEENGIKDVESIEIKVRVYDYDNWSSDPLVEDAFTFTP